MPVRVHTTFFIACLFACVWNLPAAAQSTRPTAVTDSLKTVLSRTSDTLRVPLLVLLIEKLKEAEPEQVSAYGTELAQLAGRLRSDHTRALAYKGIGNAYFYSSDFTNALFYYLRSLKLYERTGDDTSLIALYNNTGAIYTVVGKNEIARKWLLQATEIARKKNIPIPRFVYNNLGNIAFEKGNYKESIRYFKQALAEETRKDSNAPERCIMLSNIGEAYYISNNLDSAGLYFNQALRIPNANRYYVACAYSGLGKIATRRGRYNQAREYLNKALAITRSNQYVKTEVEVLKNLSALCQAQQDYRNAFGYYTQYKTLSDSVYNMDMNRQVNELQVKYETQRKNEQIRSLNTDKQLALLEADKQTSARNLLIVVCVFILVVTLVLLKNNLLKQRINRMLEEVNTSISEANTRLQHENITARYEVLKSKTNPHFLFNSLNTLSSIVFNDPAAVEYIRRFSDLYRLILETENKSVVTLEEEMTVVNHYLYLQKMRFREKLAVHTHIDPDLRHLTLPPFALQMTVENAIKHNIISRLRHLAITITAEGDAVTVTNTLQKKHSGVSSTHTGLKSIRDRYALLTQRQPVFEETATEYTARLPLLEPRNTSARREVHAPLPLITE